MSLKVLRLLRVERRVADLARAVAFYTEALGFEAGPVQAATPETIALLGVGAMQLVEMRRGEQVLVLQQVAPGRAIVPPAAANDVRFQHLALPVMDMKAAVGRLMRHAPGLITKGGPQILPPSSGGVEAFKFRDPDGLPLELLCFPDGRRAGIDHSAIVVADAARSIRFYGEQLGLSIAARQVNAGPEQDALDALTGVEVEVVALAPPHPDPHIELLAYRRPPMPTNAPMGDGATSLVLEVRGIETPALRQDPDGHALVLLPVP